MTGVGASAAISERRNLTVMIVDVVGSTWLSQEFDPEDVTSLLHDYRRICETSVLRLKGSIVNIIGDEVAACFGWPYAHEDDAERAIRVASAILDAVTELETLHRQRVSVRIGIATGMVVARELRGNGVGARELIGTAPNLAARLQHHADPDGMLICPATAALVVDRFALREVGPLSIKGLTGPMTAFAVAGERPHCSRFEARSRGDRKRQLVGRDKQLQQLKAGWALACAGHGNAIFAVGEGGIGKSCLVQAFLREVAEDHERMIFQCSPFETDTPLYPVVRATRQAWALESVEDDAAALERINAALAEHGFDDGQHLALLAMMLNLDPSVASYTLPTDSPQQVRRRLLDFLVAYIGRVAERRPTVVVLEDAHWIDPTTRLLVEMTKASLASQRILLLVTGRPPVDDELARGALALFLDPLRQAAVRDLICLVAHGKKLPAPVLDMIAGRTDGVPLFVEELTKSLLESGALVESADEYLLVEDLEHIDIPLSLNDLLNARVDHALGAKEVIQAAACIGREFSTDLLLAATGLPPEKVSDELASLAKAELIHPDGGPGSACYAFRHSLIQQAAYGMLLKSARSALHGRIADALVTLRPNLSDSQPEILARHLLSANRPVEALPLFEAAGTRAAGRSASVEAVRHLRRALDLVDCLGDDSRHVTELRLLMKIGPALMALRGYADQTVASTYRKALRLLDGLTGGEGEKIPALFGLWTYYVVSNQLDEALAIGDRLHAIAGQVNDEDLLLESHILLAVTHFARGGVRLSCRHSEAALRLYDPRRHRSHANIYGQEPGMAATTFLASSLWWLGDEAEALRTADRALMLAEASKHPFSMAFCLSILARLHMLRADAPAASALAARAAEISEEQLFPVWGATAAIISGWAEAKASGGAPAGVDKMRAGLRAYAGVGAQLSAPVYRALLLDLEGESADPARALAEIRAIRAAAEASRGLGDYVEMMRVEATLLRRAGDLEAAEQTFRQALARATEMSAFAWAMRTALDFGELLLQLGRAEEAHSLVAEYAAHVRPAPGSPILDLSVREFKDKSNCKQDV
jgi:class 3 adenylate cyclase/tetratricopeptide (TPR) repeat protein